LLGVVAQPIDGGLGPQVAPGFVVAVGRVAQLLQDLPRPVGQDDRRPVGGSEHRPVLEHQAADHTDQAEERRADRQRQ
jgi:hypothetical protein